MNSYQTHPGRRCVQLESSQTIGLQTDSNINRQAFGWLIYLTDSAHIDGFNVEVYLTQTTEFRVVVVEPDDTQTVCIDATIGVMGSEKRSMSSWDKKENILSARVSDRFKVFLGQPHKGREICGNS